MNEKHLYILLNVVNKNSSVKILTREGLSYQKIASLTGEVIKAGFIVHTKERLILSESGLAKLKELEVNFKKTNKNEWIEIEKRSVVPKLDKNSIFLPNQNELFF